MPGEAIMSEVLELSVLPPDFWGGERGWRLTRSPIDSDLITHAYITKPAKKPRRASFRELRAFALVSVGRCLVVWGTLHTHTGIWY